MSAFGRPRGLVQSGLLARPTTTHFSHDKVVSGIHTRDEAQRSDEGGSSVGKDVSVQVRGDDYVKDVWLAEEAVDHRVDNLLVHVHRFVPARSAIGLGVVVLDLLHA